MRLEFSFDEAQLIADVLSQQDRELSAEIARTDNRNFKRMLLDRKRCVHELRAKIVPGEVQSEELDFLQQVLNRSHRALLAEIVRTDSREFRNSLQHRADLMAHVRDMVAAAAVRQARAATNFAA